MVLFLTITIISILVMSSIHFILALCLANIVKGYKEKINDFYKKIVKMKAITSLMVFILSWYGVYQVTQYYLFSGAFFWYVLFTAGIILIIYLAPLGACGVSFINIDKPKSKKFTNFYWNLVGFTTWFWGVILVLDKNTAIYLDEGGVGVRYGNGNLKLLGGIGLIIVAIYVTFIIVLKYVNQKNKEMKV